MNHKVKKFYSRNADSLVGINKKPRNDNCIKAPFAVVGQLFYRVCICRFPGRGFTHRLRVGITSSSGLYSSDAFDK